ncbi:hypothetical protein BK816_04425 [Boudabousia tangfeifanii]|uniref:Apolipoprotein N-acyltransferase n=1 Tax=Boudabousia tangfeifanii TaxID=1912795 RepID=A0A1D9MK06_9ACTO|nr:nitrilase-related carbon-nitrogen hydrolase [Boudabousia tangfeifanii]AOZ72635.1 hypothetical protein BK816_04425 [Boudabousia tangfeifanii]
MVGTINIQTNKSTDEVPKRLHKSRAVWASLFQLLLAFCLGYLQAWSFMPRVPWFVFAFTFIAQLLLFLKSRNYFWAAVNGGVFGAVLGYRLFWWLELSVSSIGPVIGISLLWAIWYALLAFSLVFWSQTKLAWLAKVLLVSATLVCFEWIRSTLPFSGLPWGNFAQGMVGSRFAYYLPYVDTLGLLFVATLFISGLILASAGKYRPIIFAIIFALVGTSYLATFRLPVLPPSVTKVGTLRVGVVQGGSNQLGVKIWQHPNLVGKLQLETINQAVRAGNSAELFLLGESTFENDPNQDQKLAQEIAHTWTRARVPIALGFNQVHSDNSRHNVAVLLTGTNWQTAKRAITTELPLVANKSMLAKISKLWTHASPTIENQHIYAKQVPVPWGEYIPITLPGLPGNEDLFSPVIPGTKAPNLVGKTSSGRSFNLGTAICFEIAFNWVVDQGVKNGGEAIYVPTNNISFAPSEQSWQQLQLLRVASLRSGRDGAQASLDGVSGIVDARGQVLAESKIGQQTILISDITLRQGQTWAIRWGWILPYLALGIVLAGLLLFSKTYKRENSN